MRAPSSGLVTGVRASSAASTSSSRASRPSPARGALGRLASVLAPRLRLATRLDPGHLSRDPAVGAAYARDPLVGRRVSARWFTSVARAMADAHAAAAALPVPALVMAAGEDLLADTAATLRFVASAPRDRVDSKVWDGLYHELFNAPEKDAVLRWMRGWIEERLSD
jgi:alpha-beta hydrolase superfamily lysophospholipase